MLSFEECAPNRLRGRHAVDFAYSDKTRVALELHDVELHDVADHEVEPFRRLVVGLFGFRRKQLGRGLRELTGWEPGRVEAALARAGIPASARPETVSPAPFAVLLRALVDGGWAAR